MDHPDPSRRETAPAGASEPEAPETGAAAAAAFLPAFLLLATAGSTGNLAAPLRPSLVTVGQLLPLLLLLDARRDDLLDPLRLGPRGRWLPVALAAVVAAAWAVSPVPRAGRAFLVLAPAMVWTAPAMARWWREAAAWRRGIVGVAGALAAISLTSLLGLVLLGTPGASMPLGHHNVLAAWIVMLLPLAARALADDRRSGRILGLVAVLLAVSALVASGSLTGLVAGAVVVAASLRPSSTGGRGRRRILLGLCLLAVVLVLGFPRWKGMVEGVDRSVNARVGYLDGVLEGLAERPALGWGPGAFPWTIGLHLRPVPGVHPPDEIVGQPHSLVARVAWETGALGLVAGLLVVGAWVRARRRAVVVGEGVDAWRAAAAGLLGAGVVALVGLDEGLAATWWAVAILAAAVLAPEEAAGDGSVAESRALPVTVPLALAGVVLLLPLRAAAHRDGEAAVTPSPPRRIALWEDAVARDPDFPLYRLRLALELEASRRLDEARLQARRAAELAPGIGSFWLVAGRLLGDAEYMARACDRSPFSAIPPVLLARREPERAPERLARALLVEPRLLAFDRVPRDGWSRALELLGSRDDVPPLWRRELERVAATLPPRSGELSRLALEADRDPAASLALVAFRRRTYPQVLASLAVDPGHFAAIELPGAVALADTPGYLLAGEGCVLGVPPT